MILAGPFSHLMLLLPVFFQLRAFSWEHFQPTWPPAWGILGVIQILLFLGNLMPASIKTPFGQLPSDGRQLIHVLIGGPSLETVLRSVPAPNVFYVVSGEQTGDRCVESAASFSPKDPSERIRRAIELLAAGDWMAATSELRVALQVPGLSPAIQASAMIHLAMAIVQSGDRSRSAEAVCLVQEARARIGDTPLCAAVRGLVLLMCDEERSAREVLLGVITQLTTHATQTMCHCGLALAAYLGGDPKSCSEHLRLAREIDPHSAWLTWFHECKNAASESTVWDIRQPL